MLYAAIVVVVAAVLVLWFIDRRQPGTEVASKIATAAKSLRPSSETASSSLGGAPDTQARKLSVDAADTALMGDDDALSKSLVTKLRSLLDGEYTYGYQELFKLDGYFSHRSGQIFSVFHGADCYVIVRAERKRASEVTSVVRYVVPRDRAKNVTCITESPATSTGGRGGVTADQARNTSSAGAIDCSAVDLAFFVQELAQSTRIHGLV